MLLQPTPHRLSQTVAGDLGDPMFVTWTMAWGAHGLVTDPVHVFDANIFHPAADTLARSDPMLSIAPVFGIVEWVSGDAIVALNVVMFLLFVVALASAHALGMRIFGRGDLALVVAVVTCCNSYVFGQQNHPQLQTFGFVPLGFLVLFRAIEHRRTRDGVALGAVVVVLALANPLYALIWMTGAATAVLVLRLRGALPPWRTLVRPASTALAIAGVVLAPVALVYLDVTVDRPYEPSNSLFATDVLTPQRDNWLWGTALDGINSTGLAGEHSYFPGVLALALGGVGVVLAGGLVRRRRPTPGGVAGDPEVRVDELLAVVAAGAVALVLALGPSPGGLPGPFRLFHGLVPGFAGIRVTARFAVVTFVAAGLLVALAVAWLGRRLDAAARPWLAVVVAAVVVLEVGGPMRRVEVPDGGRLAVYERLAELPDGVVLELPIRAPDDGAAWPFTEAVRMYHATTDWNPRINGYSGSAPEGFDQLADGLATWPGPDAERALDRLGVEYVILHGGVEQGNPAFTEAELDQLESAAWALGYEVERWGEDRLVVRE